MMNFTALSLTLLWNSPIYCICSDSSSSFCRTKCAELGYYYLPNDKSFFKSLRNNINHEIKFILIPNIDSDQPFSISLPYFIFQDRLITLSPYSKSRIKVNLEIDASSIIFEKSYGQKKIELQKGSLNLNNIDLTFSLYLNTQYSYDINNIEFDSLSVTSSSISLLQIEKPISFSSRNLFIDDESIKYIALNDFNAINSSINTNNDMFSNRLPISFDELNIYLTNPLNNIKFNNTSFSFSASDITSRANDQIILTDLNISCHKIRFIQKDFIGYNTNKKFNISIFISDMPALISCDFSNIESAYINAFIKYENKTSIIDTFDIDIGSNKINIVPYFLNSEDDLPTMTDIQTMNITESEIFSATPDNAYLSQTSSTSYLYEPFFYIDGDGEILIDSISLSQLINSTKSLKNFVINSGSLQDLNQLFKSISESPYKTVSLTIDLSTKSRIIIPPSIFYKKSFHIISKNANQPVIFSDSNFSIGTFQNFTNIFVEAQSQENLNFSTLYLCNSIVLCSFTCSDLIVDNYTLELQKKLNNEEVNQVYKNLFIEIPTITNVVIFPRNRLISISDKNFEFLSDSIEKIFLISDSNFSVHFESINNDSKVDIDKRIFFTFVINKNELYQESTIKFFNSENISDELQYFSIDSHSASVKVISDGFDFANKNSIRLDGDTNVSFNDQSVFFYNNYCLCNDKNEDFDCLEVCKPSMGPILPFDKEIISNTVQLVPIKYLNFTIFGSNMANNPYFEYSLFNMTNLEISAGQISKNQDEEENKVAYLTLKTADQTVSPNKNVVCKLSNLCLIIADTIKETELFINFKTAFFSFLDFIIPSYSTLTISSEAVDTDVLTLLKFPSNLIFTSPTQMCNISCSTIISTIVILSNQQIDLGSEEYNISYRLDLSLLLHMPANISCKYGTSKTKPLKILLLKNQPSSLADIPDLRFDVSRVSGDSSYVEFLDQWNSNIEDVSSKIEIFHNDKTLYVQGKVVDDVYTTKPPTIFHNGAGYLYINGILSTFKIKYCICDVNFTDCSTICKSIGTVIPFDQESITATIKSNPTRHITYVIYGSLPNRRPYFRLRDFAVKSFTISSDTSMQFIDLETAPSVPVVPLIHRFISLSIRPISINETADMKFYSLYIENSKMECRFMTTENDDQSDKTDKNLTNINCSLSQISITTDLESAYALSISKILTPAKQLAIIGQRTVSKIVLESKNEIDLSNDDNQLIVKFDLSDISPKGTPVSISSLLGAQNNSKSVLSVELPEHETFYDQIPNLKFDLTQVDGSQCFMVFPTSMWIDDLSNLSEKIAVEYGRHDFYQESSKHEDRYDGIPPIVKAIGSGGYYINGVLFNGELMLPPSKTNSKRFRSLGPSAIAGIVVGSVAFVVLIVGGVITLKKRRKENNSSNEQTSEMIRQVNLHLFDQFSEENDAYII